MSLLESIILLLVLGSILLGGSLYYALTRKPVKKPDLPKPAREMPADDDFELSTVLFPDRPVEYVPEPPERYDETRLTAMVRDPYWIYSYWDVAAAHRDRLREIYGLDDNSHYVVRIHNFSEDQKHTGFYDQPVNIHAREWFIHVGKPNRIFQLELGALVNGNFIAIALSNPVKTPRDDLSEKIDPEWMLVDELQCKLYAKVGQSGPSSPGQWQQPGSEHLFNRPEE
jgi:hypothetical protein